MISWMQKHNKYLVWTIWVATIAFIGAGFVGWGSYNLGSKAGSVAKVGSLEIEQSKLNMVYSNIYNQYNEVFQGKLDEKQAKEMGLIKQAFARIEIQAKILNFAQEMGIVVSDQEVAQMLASIKGFQEKGQFNKAIYDRYLQSQRMKAKVFEASIREDITINKLLTLLQTKSLPLEQESIWSATHIADKLLYSLITPKDINFTLDQSKLKAYWEEQKEQFITQKAYRLAIVWTESNTTTVSDEEIKALYEKNSFNYTDATGKQLSFEAAKAQVTQDLQLKKSKKSAQKRYIAFKKGKLEHSEILTLTVGDPRLSTEMWDSITQKAVGDILKPKVVNQHYATVKIEGIEASHIKSYEEAKAEVTQQYTTQTKKTLLFNLAEERLKTLSAKNAKESEFITLEDASTLTVLNPQERSEFIQKLFTSKREKGMISLSDNIIIYNIIEQKLLPMDSNSSDLRRERSEKMKQGILESNLIKALETRYPTEVYMGGLKD